MNEADYGWRDPFGSGRIEKFTVPPCPPAEVIFDDFYADMKKFAAYLSNRFPQPDRSDIEANGLVGFWNSCLAAAATESAEPVRQIVTNGVRNAVRDDHWRQALVRRPRADPNRLRGVVLFSQMTGGDSAAEDEIPSPEDVLPVVAADRSAVTVASPEETFFTGSSGSDTAVEARFLRTAIENANLTAKERYIIEKFLEGASPSDVGVELNMSPSGGRRLFMYARKKLRTQFRIAGFLDEE